MRQRNLSPRGRAGLARVFRAAGVSLIRDQFGTASVRRVFSAHQDPSIPREKPEPSRAALGLSIVLWACAVLYGALLFLFFGPILCAVFS